MHKYFLILSLALLAACGAQQGEQNAAEMADVAEQGGNAVIAKVSNEVSRDEAPPAPEPGSLTIGPLLVPYDSSSLTPVPTPLQIPPEWQAAVNGTKLIGSDRAALIGKAECMYGQSGQASRCNAAQEAGLSFGLLEGKLEQFRKTLPAAELQKVKLAGVQGISWQIGAEGEGAEYILLPAGKRTVMIVRQFRNTGNPREEVLGTVLNELKFSE